MHELPLLIFTLFLQGSVGVTLWLAFGEARASHSRLLLPAAGAFVLASLGLLSSALHMGYPLNAFNAADVCQKTRLEAAVGCGRCCRAGGCVLHGADLHAYVGGDLAAH